MAIRIETGPLQGRKDPAGDKAKQKLSGTIAEKIKEIRVYHVYMIDGEVPIETVETLAKSALYDPLIQDYSIGRHIESSFDAVIEVDFKPGVTDNEGRTATEALALIMSKPMDEVPRIYSGVQYRLSGNISRLELFDLANEYFANTLIQRVRVATFDEFNTGGKLSANPPRVHLEHEPSVNTYDLGVGPEKLVKMSRENVWALSLNEMNTIKDYYFRDDIIAHRLSVGLPEEITDVEMECLAQSWSEHCKHKIFSAQIEYEENGKKEIIDGIFNKYIRKTTETVRELKGDEDQCLSVFKDNAGVIKFNDKYGVVFKVETHNSPSALDPYGGALTGIVGVNRDPFGTGMGAELLFNTNVFCLASPFREEETPEGLLHPHRILEGVRLGVEHGGNQSGIPTINGSLVFDERYLGKPLVYCGTGGVLPLELNEREGFEKYAEVGDLVVMVGGRIGMDGIHGATFSSEELHEGSPSSAVQIGDPITQKRMFDFLILARDRNLYNAITDNGAGGLSSSVGEMAELTNGAEIDLAKCPLKYAGIDPWEILVSESQERMTLAVPKDKIDEFMKLSEYMNVESSVIGVFNNSGYFKVLHKDKIVGELDMEFLHHGLPSMKLKASYVPYEEVKGDLSSTPTEQEILLTLLSTLNIASKEYWVRQYDHEVKGGSVIKPLMGAEDDGPSDSAVYRPFLDSLEAVVTGHGIASQYSDIDAKHMAMNAFDEAVRNCVATGGDPDTFAALDNFCWPDPIAPANNHNKKLAALVRTSKALSQICVDYKIPLISGKDSMKNDARVGDKVISIPPTLLVSVIGKLEDATKAVSMDAKQAGDKVFALGITRREIGESSFAKAYNIKDTSVPKVDSKSFIKLYRALHNAMDKNLVASCHDCSEGGIAVAAAETAFAGRLGLELITDNILSDESVQNYKELLFSESPGRFVVTVHPENIDEFTKILKGYPVSEIGEVKDLEQFVIKNSMGKEVISIKTQELLEAWKTPLAL